MTNFHDAAHRLNHLGWYRATTAETFPLAQPVIGPTAAAARRIILYSHDTQGLGHMRRNLLIAKALTQTEPRPIVLIVAGAREAGALDLAPGVDCLTLPALGKRSDGQYQPRSLSLPLSSLVALRASTISAAVKAFDPDVVIVDKVPRGAFDELVPSLQWLRARGHARCVLGLREVLDDPRTVRREWRRTGSDDAIREYYDAVWVYGDPAVYDPVREYGFPGDVAGKVRYTGYLDRRDETEEASPGARLQTDFDLPPGRLALCLVGGGQDGFHLADAFARASLPPKTNGVIVTGPFMPDGAQRRLRQTISAHPRKRVLNFVNETAPLLQAADSVVAMGGYNTVCEVLAFGKRALIVPRIKPRREQLIRAERLQRLGVLDMLHPDQLTPAALHAWLSSDSGAPIDVRARIDMNALRRIPHLLDDLFVPAQAYAEVLYAAG